MDTIHLAMIKTYPKKGDLAANHAVLMDILAEIAPHRPDVVITPECFLDGYVVTEPEVTAEDMRNYAVDLETSVYVRAAQDYASAHGCWLIYGVSRLASQGVYNSALIIDRSGTLRGVYDKTHIQTHDVKFQRGGALPVFASDFGAFGVMICADRRWPETTRTLALNGARIIFNPTYGMHDTRNQHMMETRSYESEVFIAFTHPGQSLVTGPRGEVICNNQSGDARWTLCTVDLAQVEAVRSTPSAHLRDRRSDLYS